MAETPVPPASLTGAVPPGYVLAGRYALVRLIARGGMADVWEGRDTLLERQVAVKILHPHLAADEAFVARFRTEAVSAARLHHRSIVAIFDTCSDGGIEAIVMELARGHTLREELDRHGALDPLVVINIGVDVADALQSAHAAGIVHRDIKPANILLCDDQRVMVTDFGIAKVRDNSDRTQTGTMLGSVKYVSPEQVEGKPVDPRSDVYSLGIVLFEALTGVPPFVADTPAATALARLQVNPPHPCQIRPDAPRALADVIAKAMTRSADGRHSSATELRAALLATRSAPGAGALDLTQVAPRPGTATSPGPAAPAHVPPPNGHRPPGAPFVGAAPAPPAFPTPPAPANRSTAAQRWGTLAAAMVFIAVALIVAIVAFQRRDGSSATGTDGTTPDGQPTTGATPAPGGPTLVSFASVRSFDPFGDDGGETEDKVRALVDGNQRTSWHTSCYGRQNFGTGAKTGVGVILDAGTSTSYNQLAVASPSQGWSAQVYVGDEAAGTIAEWGQPVAEQAEIAGDGTFALKGAKGRYVLVWITQLATGPAGPCATVANYPVNVMINEVAVSAA